MRRTNIVSIKNSPQQSFQIIVFPSMCMAVSSVFFAVVAWFVAMASSFYCNFVELDATVRATEATMKYGLWGYQSYYFVTDGSYVYYSRVCYAYPDFVTTEQE